MQRLADACGQYALFVTFLAYTGLRWGEFAALRVRHVDLLRRRITVAESRSEVQGVMAFGPTKTHQRRVVVLPRFLIDPLAEHVNGKEPDDLVFSAPKGGVLRNPNFRHRVLTPAAESVGLAGLSPHNFAAHGGQSRDCGRGEREGGAANDGSCLSRDDP